MHQLFKEAMARLTGVVTVITSGHGNERCGLTATAVCSLSAEPPSLLVCVNASASAHDAILANGYFGVNVLAPNQSWIADRFAGFDGRKGLARFEGSDWSQDPNGAPLLDGALVNLDCELATRFDGYSHSILLGHVKSIRFGEDCQDSCLLWHGRKYHQSNALECASV